MVSFMVNKEILNIIKDSEVVLYLLHKGNLFNLIDINVIDL